MTFCYVRITCVIWLRAGARCSTPDDIDLPRIHFVTSRRSPAASTPRGCSYMYGRRQTHDHPHCQSSPRPYLSLPCAVGLPTKLAVTSKRNVVKMTTWWTWQHVVKMTTRGYNDNVVKMTTRGQDDHVGDCRVRRLLDAVLRRQSHTHLLRLSVHLRRHWHRHYQQQQQ